MEFKALFGLTVVPAALLGGTLAACLSKRIRDVFFFLVVLLVPMIERVDVNFVSREWYRGTSRGFEVSIPGILAFCVLASSILRPMRKGESRAYWAPSLGLLLLFLFYACINVATATPRLFGYFELFKMGWGIVVFLAAAYYLRTERELRILVAALALAVCWQGLLAFKQRYLGGEYRVYGTMDEANSLSMYLCTTAPVFVAAFNSRIPLSLKALCVVAIAAAGLTEVLTISRAGVVIIALVLFGTALATMSFQITARKLAICLVVLLAATGVTAKAWKTIMTRFGESTLKEEYESKHAQGRGYYLRIAKLIGNDTSFGVGLNNWSYWVSNKYGPKLGYNFTPYKDTDRPPSFKIKKGADLDDPQAAPAHNLGALTLGEMGIPGLVLLALLWLRWFQMSASFLWRRTPELVQRLGVGLFFACCGIFLQSITEWAFRHLPVYYTFHVLLGTLASLYYLKKRERRQRKELQPEPGPARPASIQVIT